MHNCGSKRVLQLCSIVEANQYYNCAVIVEVNEYYDCAYFRKVYFMLGKLCTFAKIRFVGVI